MEVEKELRYRFRIGWQYWWLLF